MIGIQTVEFDVESLRFRLRSMDNAELLRFGQAAKPSDEQFYVFFAPSLMGA